MHEDVSPIFKMVVFQPAMLVYQRVAVFTKHSSRITSIDRVHWPSSPCGAHGKIPGPIRLYNTGESLQNVNPKWKAGKSLILVACHPFFWVRNLRFPGCRRCLFCDFCFCLWFLFVCLVCDSWELAISHCKKLGVEHFFGLRVQAEVWPIICLRREGRWVQVVVQTRAESQWLTFLISETTKNAKNTYLAWSFCEDGLPTSLPKIPGLTSSNSQEAFFVANFRERSSRSLSGSTWFQFSKGSTWFLLWG